jgi:uncharacterized protein YdeI (YjbR/CyaY-like superfamily)
MNEQIMFTNLIEFRNWLIDNHTQSKGIWLVFGKDARLKTIKPEEALEEALCFGWIDGQIKSIDETKYLKKFTPRRKGSNWSDKNRGLAAKLIEEGRMMEKGIAAMEQAKKDGTWDPPKADPISDEQITSFVEALNGIEPASSNFERMSRSVRVTYTAHYLSAKSEETRKRRLQQIIDRLNENKKPM